MAPNSPVYIHTSMCIDNLSEYDLEIRPHVGEDPLRPSVFVTIAGLDLWTHDPAQLRRVAQELTDAARRLEAMRPVPAAS